MKNIYIGRSKIAGRGIIAKEFIRKGEYICRLEGKKRYRHYTRKSQYRNEETWIPVAVDWWVSPAYPFRYLNHSCDPSAGFKTPRKVYAIRDIRPGEEVSVDYSTIEYVNVWTMHCSCGSNKCRKIIGPVQSLRLSLFKKYLPYIPKFLQKVYKSRHRAL